MGYVDIHGHYAWDIDDGISTKNEAEQALALAREQGISDIVATPHFTSGFMSSDIYRDVDDPDKGLAWPPATDAIVDVVKQSLPALARYAVDRNADRLCDDVIPRVNTLFEDVSLDADGNPKGNTGVIFTYPAADSVKKSGTYTFHYDWRIDPLKVAAQLNAMADRVLGVRGNCDAEIDQAVLTFPIMADYALLCEGGRTVFATHGHLYNMDNPPPLSPGDILLHGHTHVPCWERFGVDNFCLNPGSVSLPKDGSNRGYLLLTDEGFTWKKLEGDVYHTLSS